MFHRSDLNGIVRQNLLISHVAQSSDAGICRAERLDLKTESVFPSHSQNTCQCVCVFAVMPLKQLDVNDTTPMCVCVCMCASLNVSLSDHICSLNVN